MSWLSDRELSHRYVIEGGEEIILNLPASEEHPKEFICYDNLTAVFKETLPFAVHQTNMVEYDKNGRKAYRIKDKDGKIRHLSQTKLHFMHTGRIENKYTNEYSAQLEKQQEEQMLRTEHNKKRARVSVPNFEEVLRDMPDGEYTSNGKTVQKME